jgi:hypothetical protein
MSLIVEEINETDETSEGQPRRHWVVRPRQMPPDLVADAAAQVSKTAGEIAEEEKPGKLGRGIGAKLKRAAISTGERIYDLSNGRYGLEPVLSKEAQKVSKRRKLKERKAVKRTEKSSRASGLAWAIGLSLGLVIGMLGVAYWQRRRLQRIWGETSQRMQQATEELRQRFDAQHKASPRLREWDFSSERQKTGQTGTAGTGTFTLPGSSAPTTDWGQQTNGKVESGTP